MLPFPYLYSTICPAPLTAPPSAIHSRPKQLLKGFLFNSLFLHNTAVVSSFLSTTDKAETRSLSRICQYHSWKVCGREIRLSLRTTNWPMNQLTDEVWWGLWGSRWHRVKSRHGPVQRQNCPATCDYTWPLTKANYMNPRVQMKTEIEKSLLKQY